MNILFINTLYAPHIGGGAEITLKTLVDEFAARGHDVSVLTTGPDPGINEDQVDGIRVLRAGVSNLYWHHRKDKAPAWQRSLWHLRDSYNPTMGKIVENVVREIEPDLVCCHNLAGFSAAAWPAIKRAGVAVIQVLHDLYSICPNSNMFCQGRSCVSQCHRCKLFRLPHPRLSENVDCVIGVSRYVLERHLEFGLFSKAKIKTAIHNARNLPLIQRRTSGESNGRITFGFIGTLVPAKGVELLIKAFTAANAGSQAKLLIAGTGPALYEAELRRYASDDVRFLGYVRPEDFYPKVDVLVVPSIWQEALGMVVVEAFAYGIPVIGSRRGGIPEMIKDGVNGFLFEPDQPSELHSLLKLLVDNPHYKLQDLKKQALSTSAPYLDIDSWILKYENTFGDLEKSQISAESAL